MATAFLSVPRAQAGAAGGSVLPMALPAISASAAKNGVVNGFRITLGVPRVVFTTSSGLRADSPLTLLQRGDGTFLQYTSFQTVFAEPVSSVAKLGTGTPFPVLGAGANPPWDSDASAAATPGDWLNATLKVGNTWYGLVHEETSKNYQGFAHDFKSMAMFKSSDGVSWSPVTDPSTGSANVISNDPAGNAGASGAPSNQGDGDCTMILGQDGYTYAYCGSYGNSANHYYTFVARAPAAGGMGPGQWHNYYMGAWNEPSIGGKFSPLGTAFGMSGGWIGSFAAKIPNVARAVLLGSDPVNGVNGVSISTSNDMVNFVTLPEPLIAYDAANWAMQPSYTDLYAYPIFNNNSNGSRTLNAQHFLLSYSFVPSLHLTSDLPGDHYLNALVVQDVWLQVTGYPPSPHVLSPLSRWVQANGVLHTTAAPEFRPGARLQAQLGYVMTSAPYGQPSTKIEECVLNPTSANADYILSRDGTCETQGYSRVRTVGWVYSSQNSNTQALYSCQAANGAHFGTTDSGCEGRGHLVGLLGYMLVN